MKKLLFIFNPVSGMTRTRISLQKVIEFYDEHGFLVTPCPARRLEDYKNALDFYEYDLIVCSGGDGTLNLTASFFIKERIQRPIAYIPSGSTNDFAYSLGLPDDADMALLSTLEGKPMQIDIGQFNRNQYFLYVAAFGAFTKVSYTTSQRVKNLLGHTAYILEGIKSISELKAYHMTIELEQEVLEGDFILGMVTNSLSIGGFKKLLPQDTELDDGEFEMIFVRVPGTLNILNDITASLLGGHPEENQNIIYRRASRVLLKAEQETAWTLDGEFGGEEKVVEIENKRKLLGIIC